MSARCSSIISLRFELIFFRIVSRASMISSTYLRMYTFFFPLRQVSGNGSNLAIFVRLDQSPQLSVPGRSIRMNERSLRHVQQKAASPLQPRG